MYGRRLVSSHNDGLLCLRRRSPENSYTSGCLLISRTNWWLFRLRYIWRLGRNFDGNFLAWIWTYAIGQVYFNVQGKPGLTCQHRHSYCHLAHVCRSNTPGSDGRRSNACSILGQHLKTTTNWCQVMSTVSIGWTSRVLRRNLLHFDVSGW